MKIVLIVQARMGSSRLPGKVLKQVMGKPLLEILIERLKRVELASSIVIATTDSEKDKPIVDFCEKFDISFYRGGENNVLDRHFQAARQFKADVVVRVTSDCPLIDPALVNQAIEYFVKGRFDYVTNSSHSNFPRGQDVEVFSMKALKSAHEKAQDTRDLEHVTRYFYTHPEQFNTSVVPVEFKGDSLRLCVDTEEDFSLVRHVFEELYPKKRNFSFKDIAALIAKHPEWKQMNAHIQQKRS